MISRIPNKRFYTWIHTRWASHDICDALHKSYIVAHVEQCMVPVESVIGAQVAQFRVKRVSRATRARELATLLSTILKKHGPESFCVLESLNAQCPSRNNFLWKQTYSKDVKSISFLSIDSQVAMLEEIQSLPLSSCSEVWSSCRKYLQCSSRES